MTTAICRQRVLVGLVVLIAAVMSGCTTIRPVTISDDLPLAGDRFVHTQWEQVLERFVDSNGRVDYRALKQAPDTLDRYYAQVAATSPDSHPKGFPDADHRLAYWINAYNAGAIKTVLNDYPIESVLEVETPALFFFMSDKAGFFFFRRLTFGGKSTSLYYLENQVVRKRFGDPRIHFALNCASLGCPRLPRSAFSGDLLDRQLDGEARQFVAEDRNFAIDHDRKEITLSEIFKWYREDFIGWVERQFPERSATLLDYIAVYLSPERSRALSAVKDRYALRFRTYDWRLNDQTGP